MDLLVFRLFKESIMSTETLYHICQSPYFTFLSLSLPYRVCVVCVWGVCVGCVCVVCVVCVCGVCVCDVCVCVCEATMQQCTISKAAVQNYPSGLF